MDEPTFRATFPAFWDTARFPSAQVTFWLGIAAQQVDATRWGSMQPYGICLFAAHNLVLESREGSPYVAGSPGAAGSGPISSKSIGSVSVSYDTGAVTSADGSDLNATMYGVRFQRLQRQMGAGPVQVGGLCGPGAAGLLTPGPTPYVLPVDGE